MWKPGRWKAICDVCGFEYRSNELKDRWDGLKVCHKDWESRHPQDLLRARKETIVPPWTRPEQTDSFDNAPACFLWSISGYAGIGTAGCMQAGNNEHPPQFLYDLSQGD